LTNSRIRSPSVIYFIFFHWNSTVYATPLEVHTHVTESRKGTQAVMSRMVTGPRVIISDEQVQDNGRGGCNDDTMYYLVCMWLLSV
jgi:hypothetical protein